LPFIHACTRLKQSKKKRSRDFLANEEINYYMRIFFRENPHSSSFLPRKKCKFWVGNQVQKKSMHGLRDEVIEATGPLNKLPKKSEGCAKNILFPWKVPDFSLFSRQLYIYIMETLNCSSTKSNQIKSSVYGCITGQLLPWQSAIRLQMIHFTRRRRWFTAKGDLPGNSTVQNISFTYLNI
jgi:hypothetical protein